MSMQVTLLLLQLPQEAVVLQLLLHLLAEGKLSFPVSTASHFGHALGQIVEKR